LLSISITGSEQEHSASAPGWSMQIAANEKYILFKVEN
jgi:hypothetical protein